MAKHKGDIEIGRRMVEELYRIFGNRTKIIKQLGCGKNCLASWNDGGTPGGHMLAKLHYFGGDVMYVLTGKRSNKV